MFSIKEDSFAAATKKWKPFVSKVESDQQSQQTDSVSFNKIKRKLNFEEDLASQASDARLIFPYEGKAQKSSDINPYLRLLDSAESGSACNTRNTQNCALEPSFLYNNASYSVSKGRAKRKSLLSANKKHQ